MSLEILSPLAGDTVAAGTVTILVAYDFREKARRIHNLTCTFAGQTQKREVDDGPGQASFNFPDVGVGSDYRAHVTVDDPAGEEDYEHPILVSGQPVVRIRDVSRPRLDSATAGRTTSITCTVSGTSFGLGPNRKIHVRAYEVVPRSPTLGPGPGPAAGSRRPFRSKFRSHGGTTLVENPGEEWSIEVTVPDPDNRFGLTFRATLNGSDESVPRSTRGMPNG